jgi:hypothetical protein
VFESPCPVPAPSCRPTPSSHTQLRACRCSGSPHATPPFAWARGRVDRASASVSTLIAGTRAPSAGERRPPPAAARPCGSADLDVRTRQRQFACERAVGLAHCGRAGACSW